MIQGKTEKEEVPQMTLRDNPLATFAVLISIIGMAVAIGHTSAVAISLSRSSDAFIFVYHFLFSTITCWLTGFVLSVIAMKNGDEKGKDALIWNIYSLVVIIICFLVMQSFGAF
jgi:uncharacterized membrane protein